MGNFPKYQIKRSTNNQYYFVLRAVNIEIILTREMYVSKQACLKGIDSSKRNLADSNFVRKSTSWQFYFTQVASNGEPIGVSEMYNSVQACENGIAAVKRDAPLAGIEDLTI